LARGCRAAFSARTALPILQFSCVREIDVGRVVPVIRRWQVATRSAGWSGRRDDRWSTGEQTLITAAFGLTGAPVAFSGMRVKTFVRVQGSLVPGLIAGH